MIRTDKETIKNIIADFLKGDNITDISNNHNVSRPTISKIFKEYNIKPRGFGNPGKKRQRYDSAKYTKLMKNKDSILEWYSIGVPKKKIAIKFECSCNILNKFLSANINTNVDKNMDKNNDKNINTNADKNIDKNINTNTDKNIDKNINM